MNSVVLPKFAPPDYESKWVEDLSSDLYHSDKSHASSSDIKLLKKSAHTFYQRMADVAMDLEETEDKEDYILGSLTHLAVLEPRKFFGKYIKMPEFKGKGSVAAKEEWKVSQSPDAVIITEKQLMKVEGMVNSILAHRDASALLKHGVAEISGYYKDPVTNIQCKFRPDFMNFDLMTLVDLKTARDCTMEGFQKSIWQYRYDIQLAHYMTGVEAIMGKKVDYPVFIAVEKIPPYEVSLWVADEFMIQAGKQERHQLMHTLNECLTSNKWPKYQESLAPISLPNWALKGMTV